MMAQTLTASSHLAQPAPLPPPPPSMDIAVQLNNKGADFIGVGDFQTAKELFRSAIAVITALDPAAAAFDGKHLVDSLAAMRSQPYKPAQVPTSSEVYRQAIPLPSQCNSFSRSEAVNRNLYSACCIFNLALSYHIRGMDLTGQNQRLYFEKARSMYDKCSRLVFEHGIGCYVSKHPLLDLLSMAVLNNQSHVTHELGDFEITRSNIECLLFVASIVQPGMFPNPQIQAVLNQAKQLFRLNAILFQPPTVAQAA